MLAPSPALRGGAEGRKRRAQNGRERHEIPRVRACACRRIRRYPPLLRRPEIRLRPRRQSRMFQALVGQDQVLPVGEEARPLPHRAGQRLRRQHLAHSDGQDRQGLRRAAGHQEQLKEFKVVSTGTDVAAQLGAIEDFINQGYDAIIINAVAPDGFDRIIRLADKNNVVVVPFDNIARHRQGDAWSTRTSTRWA